MVALLSIMSQGMFHAHNEEGQHVTKFTFQEEFHLNPTSSVKF